jgi:hypothetical protein
LNDRRRKVNMKVQEYGIFVLVQYTVLTRPQSAKHANAFSMDQRNVHQIATSVSSSPLRSVEEAASEMNMKRQNNLKQLRNSVVQGVASTVIAATIWSGSIPLIDVPSSTMSFAPPQSAFAKEMASGSGSRVNKDPESLLRLGLPIANKEVCMLLVGH